MRLNLANDAYAVLATDITASDTQIEVDSVDKFPEAPFLVTLKQKEEIVKVTEVSGNVLTVDRAQEGTQAKDYPEGTDVWMNFTAGLYDELETINGAQNKADSVLADAKEYTDDEINKIPQPDLSEYAKKTEVDDVEGELETHMAKSVTQNEVHGLRVENDKLEFYTGTEWKVASGGVPVGNVKNLTVNALAKKKIEISWSDPLDTTTENADGASITLAKWAGTQLRRKSSGYPQDENDGKLVIDIKTRDTHSSTPYIDDDNLKDGTTYYYLLIPYTKDGVYTVDESNRAKATATSKFERDAPSKPIVSNIEFDRATVASSGAVVSLNQSDWFASPRTFTGLTEETGYTAYAKFEETSTHLESPISNGTTFETPSEAPGPGTIVGGDESAGFFGEVPASELFTGSEIASACGITQGTLHNDNTPWLKYIIDGKICFRPKKSVRYSISWDEINNNNCVYGDSSGKVVEKDGMRYRVRLMKGALTDPGKNNDTDRGAKGSEWNKIMLPISEKAIDGSWSYEDYVESSVPAWEHGFGSGAQGMYTDADLGFVSGNGYYHWCQETAESNASDRVVRGRTRGPSYSYWITSSSATTARGWAPVLELL